METGVVVTNVPPFSLLSLMFLKEQLVVCVGALCQSRVRRADQEKILARLASWSFHQKPTAKRGNISIEKVLYITKKQALKAV